MHACHEAYMAEHKPKVLTIISAILSVNHKL